MIIILLTFVLLCALCWHLLHQGAFANNFTKETIFIIIFYYNYCKSCYLGKVCPIYLVIVLSILAWKFGKWHAFPTASIDAWSFPRTQPICCSPASVRENTDTICKPRDNVLRNKTSFSFVRSDFLSCLPNHFSGFRKLWRPTYRKANLMFYFRWSDHQDLQLVPSFDLVQPRSVWPTKNMK